MSTNATATTGHPDIGATPTADIEQRVDLLLEVYADTFGEDPRCGCDPDCVWDNVFELEHVLVVRDSGNAR